MKRMAVWALFSFFLPACAAPLTKPLAELVAAERKFSETCGQKGIQNSFLEFFADDVATFGRELRKGKAHLRQRPADLPDSPRLQWEPVYGDISAAGDLGYTTGPYLLTTKTGETQHGVFFSIWKRQPDRAWKVILDAGLPSPKPDGDMGRDFQPAPTVRYSQGIKFDASSAREQLAGAERRFAETADKEGLRRAFSVHGDTRLRLHRSGSLPIMGIGAASEYLRRHPLSYNSELLGSDLASSGDLGFVYGSYQLRTDTHDRGFYVRVWRRNEQGEWRIVLDSMHPVPDR